MSRMPHSSNTTVDLYEDELYSATPSPGRQDSGNRSDSIAAGSNLSPLNTSSSDKENTATAASGTKRRLVLGESASAMATKRKRTPIRNRPVDDDDNDDDDAETRLPGIGGGDDEYDPDQPSEERREIRHEMRDLSKTLMDNRNELLQGDTTNLIAILEKSDAISSKVKQTSDAVIGSRFLVNTSDLIRHKMQQAGSGSAGQRLDLGEFMSKCKAYMRRSDSGDAQVITNTQRRKSAGQDGDDEEGDEDLNWEHLGRSACLPNNNRPSLPCFLLGPLSLQKRARRPIIRRAPFRPNNIQSTQPEVLRSSDIEKSADSNLTTLCTKILGRLRKVTAAQQNAADNEYSQHTEMTPSEEAGLFIRHGLSKDGHLSFLKFVINPWSFGQTIENLFYVSFLIRDGRIGMEVEQNEPYLGMLMTVLSRTFLHSNCRQLL